MAGSGGAAKHSARVARISRLHYRVRRSQGQGRGHRSRRRRSSPPVRPDSIFSEIFFSRSHLVYSARATRRPVTLIGETDAQRCARLGLEISNLANPSADAADGAAAGSGEEWTHPSSKEERSSAGDDADSRSDDASPTPTRKHRWFACTTPPYFARLCIDACCAVVVRTPAAGWRVRRVVHLPREVVRPSTAERRVRLVMHLPREVVRPPAAGWRVRRVVHLQPAKPRPPETTVTTTHGRTTRSLPRG